MTQQEMKWICAGNRPHGITEVRKLFMDYDNDRITFSKLLEELNLAAYRWHLAQPVPAQKPGYTLTNPQDGEVYLTPDEQETLRKAYFKNQPGVVTFYASNPENKKPKDEKSG